MTLVELTEMIVKSLVSDPDSISVKEFPNDDEIIIEVVVKEEDMGSVIGREGKIANSIRTVVQASSYLKDNKRVKINISSF
ncbi:uPF0109 protein HMPREF9129_1781 [Clostridium sp. CAG:433]|jgi:predicted RNA-binding protein YlqC (UPF0109 family)|nr:KH domain-containing protein [Bacilli bacterium]CDD29817.1 uPF0109 protein HMPREF9129_1781 [Clostridium sp. CAG:433]